MKLMRSKILAAAFAALATAAVADVMPSNDALMAMMREMYAKDMQSASGRIKWHGVRVAEAVDTNALIKVETYADGYTVTNAWHLTRPIDLTAIQARKLAVHTNGVPAKLAEARLRRAKAIEQGETEVSVQVEVGHK